MAVSVVNNNDRMPAPQVLLRQPEFSLRTERLGPLPRINHFLQRSGLEELLDRYVPTLDRRCAVHHAKALGVLVRSIIVEREPVYRQEETVHGFAPGLFGLGADEREHLYDDRIGRALDISAALDASSGPTSWTPGRCRSSGPARALFSDAASNAIDGRTTAMTSGTGRWHPRPRAGVSRPAHTAP